jgi:pimeloyl-ACP methyl ester carboxylesterase
VGDETELMPERWQFTLDGVELSMAALTRAGRRAPVVALHGFGSTKEDYADFARQEGFTGRGFLAYDAPGCGESHCADLTTLSVPFLVRTAEIVLRRAGIERFHLVGHSLGGLTALLLAHRNPGRVLSFVDIEGNLAPEDCFLSRQIVSQSGTDAEKFLDAFADRASRAPTSSSALYAAGVRHKVRAGAVRGIFESMVELSDHGDLMARFLSLPFPRMFLYGQENASLSYLQHLADNGVRLAAIPSSGHWPMYANPVATWEQIAGFVDRAERA